MLFIMMALVVGLYGQQVIGTYPSMGGGFENESGTLALASSITTAQSNWTTSIVSTGVVSDTGGRSGPKYVTFTQTGASHRRLQSPTASVPTGQHIIQFYYQGDIDGGTYGDIRGAVSAVGTSSPAYGAYVVGANVGNNWTKYSAVVTPSGTPTFGIGLVSVNSTAQFRIDDLVVYAGSAVDVTAPGSPGTVTIANASTSSLDVSWVASSSVDGGGYVVVRYLTDPGTVNDPIQNGIYAVGNTVATGGTVRYIGAGTSFTDNVGMNESTHYWYKVYTVDKAFNYSDESAGDGTTASLAVLAPTIQAYSLNFGNIQQTQMDASWTVGDGAKRIVIINTSNSFTNPTDGTDPTPNTVYAGSGEQVVYNNNSNTVTVTGLTGGTTYWVRVYEYNGASATTKYLVSTATDNPKSQATSAAAVAPTVATTAITAITDITATGGGDVTSDGGASITDRGICWGTSLNPVSTGLHYSNGSGAIGAYTSYLVSLTANTLYHVRAYATNSAGTNYGSDLTFTTLKAEPAAAVTVFTPGTTTINTIPLTWEDVTADGFLIKGSNVGYGSIVDPVDGTPETDAALVKNIAWGIQAVSFTALSSNTTYYFKIYPFNNSGTGINYKTGSAAQASAATLINVILTVTPTTSTFGAYVGSNSTLVATVTSSDLSTGITVSSAGPFTFAETSGGSYENPHLLSTNYNGSVYIKFTPLATVVYTDSISFDSASKHTKIAPTATGYVEPTSILFVENFDYIVAQNLTANGWTAHSGANSNPIKVADDNLTYANYPSVTGKCAGTTFTGTTSAEDVNKSFGSILYTGSGYVSFLMSVPTTTNIASDYFLHFGSPSAGDFKSRVSWKKDPGTSGNYAIGISKTAAYASANYTGYNYQFGTTYLIVMRYDIVPGATNDVIKLWVNPTISSIEPTTPDVSALDVTGADIASISNIDIRQGNPTSPIKIDGIRVAHEWAYLFPPTITVTSSFTQFAFIAGDPSPSQSYHVKGSYLTENIDVTAPTHYELSLTDAAPWTGSLSLAPTFDGTVYIRLIPSTPIGNYNGNILHTSLGATIVSTPVSGTVNASGYMTIDGYSAWGDFTAYVNSPVTPSENKSYTLAGTDLLETYIHITASTTAGATFEVSKNGSTGWTTQLDDVSWSSSQTIYVRFSPTAAGTYNGTITNYCEGAVDQVINVTGIASIPYVLTAVPSTLAFSTVYGTTSDYQSYELTSSNLDTDITVTAPAQFEIATSSSGPWSGTLLALTKNVPHTIYVHYVGLATPGTTPAANISNVSDISTNVSVSGATTDPPMHIQVGQTLTQNFNLIGTSNTATVPYDWKVAKSANVFDQGTWAAAVSATEQLGGNALSSTAANGIYNFGAGVPATATDRAIGFLSSGGATKTGNLYTKITNTGSSAITGFTVSYKAEKYRTGTNPEGFGIKLYSSPDGTTWTYAGDALKASWPLDATTLGYTPAPGDSLLKSGTVVVDVAPASIVYFCWSYGINNNAATTYAQALAIDDISILALDTQFTKPVTYSVTAGLQDGPVDVTLSSATSGANIYYTVNGDEPTLSSTPYSIPIHIAATQTIKAIAMGTAPGAVISPSSSAYYQIPIDVASIAALRLLTADNTTPYRLTSEVVITLQSTTRNSKYIQEISGATPGAILIDDAIGTITRTYNVKDKISNIVGKLYAYNNMLQFIPLKNTSVPISSGNEVTPVVVTLAGLNESHEAKLVTLENVSITDTTNVAAIGHGTFVVGRSYSLNSGAGWLRTQYAGLDYLGTAVPATPKTVTGVVLQNNTVYQVVPRDTLDISDGIAPEKPTNVVVNVVGNNVVLSWTDDPTVSSWKVYYSDVYSAVDYAYKGTTSTNSITLTGEALDSVNRFYYVKASR